MVNAYDDDFYDDDDDQEGRSAVQSPSKIRLSVVVVSLALVALAGIYLWSKYSSSIEYERSHAEQKTAAPAVDPEVVAALQDLRTSQQQTAEKVETIDQHIAAQQADLKTLSEQLSALAARVDALQSVANTPSNEATRSSLLQPEPDPGTRTVTVRSKKPLRTPKPAGPVSVGGAPLNTATPIEPPSASGAPPNTATTPEQTEQQ